MIFDLTDDDRAALEAIRKNRGHRSHAETLRELIRQAASSGLPTPEQQVAIQKAVAAHQVHRSDMRNERPASVPLYGTFKRPVAPKKGK